MISPSIVNDGFRRVVALLKPLSIAMLLMIELADVIEDDGRVLAMGLSVLELAPGVNPATCQGDSFLFRRPCLVGTVAVALQDAFEAPCFTC